MDPFDGGGGGGVRSVSNQVAVGREGDGDAVFFFANGDGGLEAGFGGFGMHEQ